jgi:glycosyltransferase involved in cell wall biosynthesis
MTKICFVIPRAYYLFNPDIDGAEDKIGGAQLQSYLLSTETAKDSNFDVHFCVADFNQPEFEEIQKVKIRKSFSFNDNIFKRLLKLFKTLKNINADFYIFRSADAGVAVAVFYIKRVLRKKIIYMIAADAEISKKRQQKYHGKLTAAFMSYTYKKADILTAQTRQQFNAFEEHRKRKPDRIIKNIYPDSNKSEINRSEKKTILWVGRLTEIKNPERFLILAKNYPDYPFVMIAPIVREKINYGREIQEKAEKIKNLQLINYVKPELISDYYENAKVFVLTSDYEGFSNTSAEAMKAECAVLSYSVNPDKIIDTYKLGYCANGSFEKFTSDFETLITNNELCKTFGKNGVNYIKTEHQKGIILKEFKLLFS